MGRDGPVVLKKLSGRIPARSITALLGPNGSGKTTLLHLLLGLLAHKEGDILVSGKPLGDYSPKRDETIDRARASGRIHPL